jgi:hypothetical protein
MRTSANTTRGGKRTAALILLAVLLSALIPAIPGLMAGPTPQVASAQAPTIDPDQLPFQFEPNVGQTGPEVKFLSHAPGGTYFFTSSGVQLSISVDRSRGKDIAELRAPNNTQPPQASVALAEVQDEPQSEVVRIDFIGSNPDVSISGCTVSPGKVNYFIGSDPARWRSNLPLYEQVNYASLYTGIDLTYGGPAGRLKGTYTVAPGADHNLIRWQYGGSTRPRVSVTGEGMLQVRIAGSVPLTITEQAPVAWQEVGGERVPVQVAYDVAPDGSVGFNVGAYDPTRQLIIDPTLTYSTYLGGNFAETGYSLAVDPAGNFYVTGYTNSSNFPTRNGYQPNYGGGGEDGFVAKFNAQGQPVYITYLGGNSIDSGYGIATDSDGNAYVTGFTASANFPIVNAYQPNFGGGFYDAFVTKLNPSGSGLVFSTYLGGTGHENSQGSGSQSGEIEVDSARNIYIAGYTTSTNFPTRNPIQPTNRGGADLFITKLNPAANDLVWSTYLGGTSTDIASGIAVDGSSNVAVAGYTYSEDYPVQNAYQWTSAGPRDGIVTKLNAAGSALIYSTYLGGHMDDLALDIDLDSSGNTYVAGHTDSTSFPLFNAFDPIFEGLSEAFVAKFTPAGGPVFVTYLGGGWLDGGHGVAGNEAGETFVMGSTQSDDFPLMNPLDPTLGGSEDAFVSRFNSTGTALTFSTYFGGNDNRELQNGASLEIDGANNIYISGDTGASDFPTTQNAFQPFRASAVDAFVSRISEQAATATPTATGSPTATPIACIVGDYTVTQSSGAAIVPGTTYLPNSACDECTAPIAFPFPVRFYDQTFTQGRVSSEGNLQFTGNNPLNLNFCLPYGGLDNTIYAFWDDLYIGGDGVFTSVSGSAPNRIFNIEWRGELALSSEPINFEIRLYEGTGQIDLIYAELGGGSGQSSTVGVQRGTGSRYTQFSCNQPLLSPGLKLTFTMPPCLTPTSTPQTPTNTPTATATPPTLLYSTYYGSYERDSIVDIGRDAAGNIYVAGTTFQSDIDFGDMYLSKFSPNGQQLIYQTLLGGTRVERAYTLAVDPAGNATVAGVSTSLDYPVLNPLQANHAGGAYDVVITKLNPTGGMVWSTYLGGNEVDYGIRLRSDAAGNLYLTGQTESPNFPTTANAFQPGHRGSMDGFVTKINPGGTALVWSTYLGGIYQDGSFAVTTDAQGNVYATGHTTSPDFPTLNPFQPSVADTSGDAFVTKLNPDGSGLVYSTFLGGSHQPGPGEDSGFGIAVDAAGHAYVTGWTESPNFPTTLSSFQPYFQGYEDVFVTKLVPAGNALVYSTFLGGTRQEEGFDIAVDGAGQAHVTGFTDSIGFPVVNAIQPMRQDRKDAFVTKFNAAGSAPVYSTFLGGDAQIPFFTGDDAGAGIFIDAAGGAVIGGSTSSYDFPVANAYQFENAGESDGFIARISGSNPVVTHTATPTGSHTVTRTPTITATPTVCGFSQALFEGFESNTLGAFTATAIPANVPGWRAVNTASHSGQYSAFAPNHWSLSDVRLTTTSPIAVPANATGVTLSFWHRYVLEPGYSQGECTDGAVLEFSTDGGQNWVDAEPYITAGGYDGRIYEGGSNPLAGRMAWCGSREIFGNVSVNLQSFAGQNVLVRFRQGTDTFIQHVGWWVDDVSVSFTGPCVTTTPTAPATASPTVTPNSTVSPTACALQFSDVPPGSTFYDYVRCLACRGIVSGYSDGTFRPGNNVTRGQLSKIVAGAAGFIEPVSGQTFSDVPPTHTFYEFIERLAARGIVGGYTDGTFRPENNATRGQISKIVAKARGWEDPMTSQTFEDVPPGSTFYLWVENLGVRAVMNGYACGVPGEPCGPESKPYFRPANNATRGQVSKVVANTFFPGCNPGR